MNFETWVAAVTRALVAAGMDLLDAHRVPHNNDAWFRCEYDDGQDADMTATKWLNNQ